MAETTTIPYSTPSESFEIGVETAKALDAENGRPQAIDMYESLVAAERAYNKSPNHRNKLAQDALNSPAVNSVIAEVQGTDEYKNAKNPDPDASDYDFRVEAAFLKQGNVRTAVDSAFDVKNTVTMGEDVQSVENWRNRFRTLVGIMAKVKTLDPESPKPEGSKWSIDSTGKILTYSDVTALEF
jgi:hypothetical protein